VDRPYLLATPNDQALVSSLPASSPPVTSTVCRPWESLPVVGDERFVAHAGERTSPLGLANGSRSQAAENSCDSMPNAVLVRV
jgi:hypothetical protein